MAKTYIDTVKYLVYTNVEISGLVEKPDVVGAIFGQTEGLLGDELDLRDLQKNGRIGRIEVDLRGSSGKTIGSIKIPSSLDMVETSIIAAALETVDRVGPCEAHLKVTKIEDTRNSKRKILVDRAKNLLRNMLNTEIPESREISDMVRDEVKTAEISTYGQDRLPAGPGIDRVNEVIFVEGRADVINMLKNDISNVVAIEGAKVPRTIVTLSKKKEVTVFLDGDRGGDIILNELAQGGVDIDFVARAPIGMEVEELTRKEIIKCLRNKVPYEQSPNGKGRRDRRIERDDRYSPKRQERQNIIEQNDNAPAMPPPSAPVLPPEPSPQMPEPRQSQRQFTRPPRPLRQPVRSVPDMADEEQKTDEPLPKVSKDQLLDELEELSNSLRARFYNSNFERTAEVPVRDVIKSLSDSSDVKAIVFDGIITQRLVDLAAKQGIGTLVGIKIGNVNKTPEGIEIITKKK
ncbi:MAG: DNA primase DnaG [Candidatus Micrarchaeota archaeon]